MDSALPRISIVTPCLNQRPFIGGALESVLDQAYPGLEYVVVDGGSDDGTREEIELRASRLAWWASEPDGGQYAALNKGFAHTTGDVMGYLNGDDVLARGALLLVGHVFALFPEVEWLSGGHMAVDVEGRPVRYTAPARWSRWHLLSDRIDRFLPQESTYWRRSLWERAGGRFDEAFGLAADFELWARFSRTASLRTISVPLGCFRFVTGQRSVVHADRYREEVRSIRRRERSMSRRDARASRIADALLAIPAPPTLRRKVDMILGAEPAVVYDETTATLRAERVSEASRRARSALEALIS